MKNDKSSRVFYVDILRALALLYLVISHVFGVTQLEFKSAIINNLINYGGTFSVSIFFVLSGFSIYKLLDKKKYKYIDFIKSRIRKLGPHYYISIAVSLLFTASIAYLNREHLGDLFAHIFFLHNCFYSYHGSFNGVLWTMGVIFQFYLIAPFLKKLIDKKPILTTIFFILFSIFTKFIVYKFFTLKNLESGYFFVYGRQIFDTVNAFVLGMYIAKISRKQIPKWIQYIGLIFSVIIFIFMLLFGSGSLEILQNISVYSFTSKGIFYFCFLEISIAFLLLFLTQIKYKPNFLNEFLLFISKHEYSIYVWHLLILYNFFGNAAFTYFIKNTSTLVILLTISSILIFLGIIADLLISNIQFENIQFVTHKKNK